MPPRAWLIEQGLDGDATVDDPGFGEVEDLLRSTPSGYGLLQHVAMPGAINGEQVQWSSPPPLPGSSEPLWAPTLHDH